MILLKRININIFLHLVIILRLLLILLKPVMQEVGMNYQSKQVYFSLDISMIYTWVGNKKYYIMIVSFIMKTYFNY